MIGWADAFIVAIRKYVVITRKALITPISAASSTTLITLKHWNLNISDTPTLWTCLGIIAWVKSIKKFKLNWTFRMRKFSCIIINRVWIAWTATKFLWWWQCWWWYREYLLRISFYLDRFILQRVVYAIFI